MKSLRNAFLAMHAAACCMASMPAGSQSLPQDLEKMNPQACIPAHQFAELLPSIAGTQTDAYGKTTVALGAYERVSPDGRYVLRSFSGQRLGEVSLIELSADGQVLRAIPTPLKNEAFPVQGSWRYLVDTNGDHYTFDSILSLSNLRKPPVFRGGMDGFYAAAAELPSPKPGHIRIRSLSWPNASGDPANQGEGALMSRTIEVDVQRHRITADSGTVFHCRERVAQDGSLYALPMISMDGREFAALPQTPVQGKQTMRIFGFGDSVNGMASQAEGRGCELKEAFDFSSGKAIFGFSNTGQKADLAWEYNGQAFWYSRELERPFNIAPFELQGRATGQDFELLASAFPGITKDGRVIYGATLKDCTRGVCRDRAGYMISDPYQSNAYRQFMLTYKAKGHEPVRQQCITEGDVMRERAAWEATIKP